MMIAAVTRKLLGAVSALVLLSACGDEALLPAPTVWTQTHFDYPLDDVLTLAHVQAKSTHNSYHIEPDGNELEAWAYTHLPLDEQARLLGVRHFELDVRRNPTTLVFEVFHLPIIDDVSTCADLAECLTRLRTFSDAFPGHHPLVVQLELKDGTPADYEEYFAALHAQLTSVFVRERIVTPAMVQGARASVGEAIAMDGWPSLGRTRGMVLFTLDDTGSHRRAYTHDEQSLDGRLLFPDSAPGQPFGAIAVENDPSSDSAAIAEALATNMLVRTRADSDSVEPYAGDTSRKDAALASGAHFVSTDYPTTVAAHDYALTIPAGSPSRCNPVTAPKECTSAALEDPARLAKP